jgi:hypothetical protein
LAVVDATFTVNVTLAPRGAGLGPTVAVDVHGAAAALADGDPADRNKPNDAITVTKATARTRKAESISLDVGRRTARHNQVLRDLSKILGFATISQASIKLVIVPT